MSTTKLFASIPALRSSIQKDIETYELPTLLSKENILDMI